MALKPIRTKKDYRVALKGVDTLWTAKDGTDDADRLGVLTILIKRGSKSVISQLTRDREGQ